MFKAGWGGGGGGAAVTTALRASSRYLSVDCHTAGVQLAVVPVDVCVYVSISECPFFQLKDV